ncbi:hypothetical protein F4808DRAFT_472498 [Astrocystis sublimbata]|nr:hypothetical protein F4808DRAFT_472498 [Astrocystis sublimbata]
MDNETPQDVHYRPLSLNLGQNEFGQLIHSIDAIGSDQITSHSETGSSDTAAPSLVARRCDSARSASTDTVQEHIGPNETEGYWSALKQYWQLWFWETVSFLAVIALLASVIGILAENNGKKQIELPYRISLNTLVALLSTLLRTLMLIILEKVIGQGRWSWFQVPRALYDLEIFDRAGRGPWGSLKYLTRIHRLHPSTIAAVVLILSLGISTFTQQAIQSTERTKLEPGQTAWVRKAQIIWGQNGNSIDLPSLDIPAVEALFEVQGFETRQIPFSCPSGNCTFRNTYASVGICNKCADVTPHMGFTFANHTPDASDEHPELRKPNTDLYCQWPTQNRTTDIPYAPRNPTFQAKFGVVTASMSGFLTASGNIHTACNLPVPVKDREKSLPNTTDPIFSVCWLYPCLRHYNGSVTNGILREVVVDTELLPLRDRLRGEPTYGSYDRLCRGNGTRMNDTVGTPEFTGDKYSPNNSQTTDLDCWYEIRGNPIGLFALSKSLNWLSGVFWEAGQLWMSYMVGLPWATEFRYEGGVDTLSSISSGMDRLATAMTNALRTVGSDSHGGDGRIYGQVWSQGVCTQINWPWFSFPAALILATLYILVASIVGGVRKQTAARTWKSSALPLLYYGPPRQHEMRGLETERDLRRDAKQRRVCLREDDEGNWRLNNEATMEK